MPQVEGPFQVKLSPQPLHAAAEGMFGRMALDKRFEGALHADSRGEMLAATTAVPGSAGYVALEKVDGALDGRRGSFLLLHSGLMNRGQAELTIVVVPDSGSGELEGLSGRMKIDIREGGAHFYRFEYALPGVE
ncbi:hypothetical protein GLE_4585 [Lysobacter enzymogenes]|uniref:Uncharacterized protein n=1 Tax=Lysobacter enzymogenes TaxID=69 RepID=A0A0S2DMN1_LYSEN|nr:DUF3224 domain-containing protein [Lysobacter enzymogenes]ALN59926.1 hypothetical protein GLE_4585 [Lysobacter enzymogenes]QCW27982.1 DUF3224 domain-containing protein [Lysobacter enzymogenes]